MKGSVRETEGGDRGAVCVCVCVCVNIVCAYISLRSPISVSRMLYVLVMDIVRLWRHATL